MNTERRLHRAADEEQRARRPEPAARRRATYRAPVVASYDPETGRLRWGDQVDPAPAPSRGTLAPTTFGEDSWKWLFLQPLTQYPEVTDAPDPDEPAAARRTATFRLVLLGRAASSLLIAWPRQPRSGCSPTGAARPSDAQAERDAVMSQTEQFVLRLNTYGPDELDAQGHLPEYQRAGERGDHPEVRRRLRDRRASRSPSRRSPRPGYAPHGRGLRRRRRVARRRLRHGARRRRRHRQLPRPEGPGRRRQAGRRPARTCSAGRSTWSRSTASGWSTTTRP